MFSYEEIKDICKLSLSKIEESITDYEQFREETSEFYTRYIFKLLGKEIDEEIPTDDFKNAIFHGDQETKEILSMFCFADAKFQDAYSDEKKFKESQLSPKTLQILESFGPIQR